MRVYRMTPQDQMSAFCNREGQHDYYLVTDICARPDVSLLQHRRQLVAGKLPICGAPGCMKPNSLCTITCPHLQHRTAARCRGSKHGSVVHMTTPHEHKCSCSSTNRPLGWLAQCEHGPKGLCEPHEYGPAFRGQPVELASVKLVATVSVC